MNGWVVVGTTLGGATVAFTVVGCVVIILDVTGSE